MAHRQPRWRFKLSHGFELWGGNGATFEKS